MVTLYGIDIGQTVFTELSGVGVCTQAAAKTDAPTTV